MKISEPPIIMLEDLIYDLEINENVNIRGLICTERLLLSEKDGKDGFFFTGFFIAKNKNEVQISRNMFVIKKPERNNPDALIKTVYPEPLYINKTYNIEDFIKLN